MDLDNLDTAIIEQLRRNGRSSYESLGAASGLSPAAARSRVQRLLDHSIVRIEAIVHPSVESYNTFAHVVVRCSGGSRAVGDAISDLSATTFVSLVAGRWSVAAELRTKGLGEMQSRLDAIRNLTNVMSIESALYTDVIIDPHLPLGSPSAFSSADLDVTDRFFLQLLQQNPRATFSELASHVDISRAATHTRVRRLLDNGIVVVKGLADATALGMTRMCGFAVTLSADVQESVRTMATLPGINVIARTIGRCDVIGTVTAQSNSAVISAFETIRSLPSVYDLETWWHLEIVKERYAAPIDEV